MEKIDSATLEQTCSRFLAQRRDPGATPKVDWAVTITALLRDKDLFRGDVEELTGNFKKLGIPDSWIAYLWRLFTFKYG